MTEYFLNRTDYTWENALLWGFCIKHGQAAQTGELCSRSVHLILAGAEALPLIGQLVSLIEMALAGFFQQEASTPTRPLPRTPPSPLPPATHETNHPGASTVSSAVSSRKANRPAPGKYTRGPLVPLSSDNPQSNQPIPLGTPPEGITHCASSAAIFYGYNSEGIKDAGWGCAWRAIQTCLSGYEMRYGFEELFAFFGSEDKLSEIYASKYSGAKPLQYLPGNSPHTSVNGWAEPFIGEMVFHYLEIEADLKLIHGIPTNSSSPQQVFGNPPLPLDFSGFRERLQEHFQSPSPAPVMIDDGLYAMNIIGIGDLSKEKTIQLWIADPHIAGGSHRNIEGQHRAGLYTVTLDQHGTQTSCSVNTEKDYPKASFSYASYNAVYFAKPRDGELRVKSWMVLFPQPVRAEAPSAP